MSWTRWAILDVFLSVVILWLNRRARRRQAHRNAVLRNLRLWQTFHTAKTARSGPISPTRD